MSSLAFDRSPFSPVALRRAPPALVPMYTPLWHATKVMSVTANSWWEGGVPPVRRRGQRAADAVAHVAAGVVRRLQRA